MRKCLQCKVRLCEDAAEFFVCCRKFCLMQELPCSVRGRPTLRAWENWSLGFVDDGREEVQGSDDGDVIADLARPPIPPV